MCSIPSTKGEQQNYLHSSDTEIGYYHLIRDILYLIYISKAASESAQGSQIRSAMSHSGFSLFGQVIFGADLPLNSDKDLMTILCGFAVWAGFVSLSFTGTIKEYQYRLVHLTVSFPQRLRLIF